MEQFYLRHRKNGVILSYFERLANHPDMEKVTAEEAFPEKFASKKVFEHEPQVFIAIPESVTKDPPVEADVGHAAQVALKLPKSLTRTRIKKEV